MNAAELMRPYLDAMWSDRDPLVHRVARAVIERVPSYASTPSSEVWIGMTRILERAIRGNPFAEPTEEDRLAALGTGVQGAGAGIRPEDLVAAVLLGAREVEADVLARAAADGVSAENRLTASELSRRWAEQLAAWATEGLVGAGHEHTERHVFEHRLITALRHHGSDAALPECAAVLGIDSTSQWYAAVALSTADDNGVAATSLRLANPGAIWATPDAAEPAETAGLLAEVPHVPAGLVVGIAGPGRLAELSTALSDAGRAARVARRFGQSVVVTLDDLGLLVPLHEDPALARRLVTRWATPLSAEPRHELLATMQSWLEHDGQVDRVAKDFDVHANTIRNRLARIGVLLGPDWRSPRSLAEIWAALQVAG